LYQAIYVAHFGHVLTSFYTTFSFSPLSFN
jgi:hypothetical protein